MFTSNSSSIIKRKFLNISPCESLDDVEILRSRTAVSFKFSYVSLQFKKQNNLVVLPFLLRHKSKHGTDSPHLQLLAEDVRDEAFLDFFPSIVVVEVLQHRN